MKKFDKFNLQDYLSYSIPTEEDLIQCKQLMMFYIFGEGYITNFTVDDIKAGCYVLSY